MTALAFRLAGGALLVMGGWLLGRRGTETLRRRAALLRELGASLGLLADELASLNAPLPAIFERLRDRPFFELLHAGFGSAPLPELWRRAAEALDIGTAEREALSSLAPVVGRYDAARQCAAIAAARRRLDEGAARLEAEIAGRAKNYPGLGAACGAILAVMLL